jgi:hypothetical protein
VKRDAPAGPGTRTRSPAATRDAGSLRAQLTRAVGDALRAVRSGGGKSVSPSKQRLTDVLWNDRTMLAQQSASAPAAPDLQPPAPLGDDRAATDTAVEVVSDNEVASWFEAPDEDEPITAEFAVSDLTAASAFSEAIEVAVAEAVIEQQKSLAPPVETVIEVDAVDAAPKPAPSPRVAAAPVPVPEKPAAVAVAASASEAGSDDDTSNEEPIRTRSMARLLAGQGHKKRALAIYDALLKADAGDASLRAEADALRQAGS